MCIKNAKFSSPKTSVLKKIPTITIALFLFISLQCWSQNYAVKFEIANQPATKIVLGWVKGDSFTAMDSLQTSGEQFQFTLTENNHAGVYRVILGKTPYARLMEQAPQQLDFIFNYENISIQTDFKTPFDSALVILSEENRLWYSVRRKHADYKNKHSLLQKEVDHFWNSNDTTSAWQKSNDYNRLQMAHDIFLGQQTQQNASLLASKFFACYREPLTDAYLTPEERQQVYQQDFFKTVDFSHPELMYSTVYTDKVFEYLVSFNNPNYTQAERERVYKPAVDEIMKHIQKDEEVFIFLKNYLIHGFELLQMQSVVNYINDQSN